MKVFEREKAALAGGLNSGSEGERRDVNTAKAKSLFNRLKGDAVDRCGKSI